MAEKEQGALRDGMMGGGGYDLESGWAEEELRGARDKMTRWVPLLDPYFGTQEDEEFCVRSEESWSRRGWKDRVGILLRAEGP